VKHPELSGLLMQFGTTYMKADGGETPQSAPVTKPHDPVLAKFHPGH